MPITNKELLFQQLVQPHWDSFSRDTLELIERERKISPQIFISYAWPNQRYASFNEEQDIQTWLLGLYARLSGLGGKVLFDIKSMALGANIDDFMQQGIAHSDKILIIGTQSYYKRSEEPTNVKREVDCIRNKLRVKGTDCIIPVLYRGDFGNALPQLGVGQTIQILGTDCHNKSLYHKNLSLIVESIFQLRGNVIFEQLKQTYLSAITHIENHGLNDWQVDIFAQDHAAEARAILQLQEDAVFLAIDKVFRAHPDYQTRPLGTEPVAAQLLTHLQQQHQRHDKIHALFGQPMQFDKQYINLHMLFQTIGAQKNANADKEEAESFHDKRMTSHEDIFSQKKSLAVKDLFVPAQKLLQEHQKTQEEDPTEEPRFLLIQGRAGIGKTTFTQFAGREWSLGRLWSNFDWVFTLRFRDLREHRFAQAYAKGELWSLADWVYEIYFTQKIDKAAFASLWQWLIAPQLNDKILFILDGLDEAPLTHPCQQALLLLLNSPIHKIVTSRPYGLGDLPRNRRELEVVGFTDENVERYIQLFFAQQKNKAQQIITALKANTSLWGNAHIPVSVNILCGVLQKAPHIAHAIERLETMTGLYEEMELALLEHAYLRTNGNQQLRYLDTASKKTLLVDQTYATLRYYLSQLALGAFGDEDLVISPERVNQVLRTSGVLVQHLSTTIDALLALGLLKPVLGEGALGQDAMGYEFLHLTFQEYYAGLAIAQRLMNSTHENDTIFNMLLTIKFNPRYQIVLWFAAGLLNSHPIAFNRLMQVLNLPSQGDMTGHVKLGIQLRCVHEAWEAAQQTGWVAPIAGEIQNKMAVMYAQHVGLCKVINKEIKYRHYSLPVWILLLQLSPRWLNAQRPYELFEKIPLENTNEFFPSFIKWTELKSSTILLQLLSLFDDNNTWAVNRCIIGLISSMGSVVVTPFILNRFEQLALQQPENRNSDKASLLETVGEFGSALATSAIIKGMLEQLYRGNDYAGKMAMVSVLVNMGIAISTIEILKGITYASSKGAWNATEKLKAAIPEILPDLVVLLNNPNDKVRIAAAGAIGNIGKVAAKPEILATLAALLRDKNQETQVAAIHAIDKLSDDVTPAILTSLNLLLQSNNKILIYAAVESVCALGARAAKPEILSNLARLMRAPEWETRRLIAENIGKLGTAAVIPEIQIGLTRLLYDKEGWTADGNEHGDNDEDELVRSSAARAIQSLGVAVVTSEILTALIRLLDDENHFASHAAEDTLKFLFNVSVDLRRNIFQLLRDKTQPIKIRSAATRIIGNINLTTLTAGFPDLFIRQLSDENETIRFAAASAIGDMDIDVVTDNMFIQFILLLRDPKENVRRSAAASIEKFIIEKSPSLLAIIPRLLQGNTVNIRSAIAEYVGRINIGIIVTHPDILTQLALLLHDTNEEVCIAAISAIERLGPTIVSPDIFADLTVLLSSHKSEIQRAAMRAIAKLGAVAATPHILKILVRIIDNRLLFDREPGRRYEWDHRYNPAQAVKDLGAAAATPDIFRALTRALHEIADLDIKFSILKAIGKLDTSGEVIEPLILQLLQNKDEKICQCTLDFMNHPDVIVATFQVYQCLLQLLSDKNPLHLEIRDKAAEVIGKLGRVAIPPRFIELLDKKWKSKDTYDRYAAYCLLKKLGAAVVTPTFHRLLLQKLHNEDKNEQSEAVNYMVKAEGEITFEIFKLFAQRLVQGQLSLNYSPVDIFKCLIEKKAWVHTVTIPEMLNILVQLFGHKDWHNDSQELDEFLAATIRNLTTSANALPESLITLTEILCEQKNPLIHSYLIQTLADLSLRYYNMLHVQNRLPPLVPEKLLLALLIGSYYAGEISASVTWQVSQQCFAWQGFAGKKKFTLLLTQGQANLLAFAAPRVITLLEQQNWTKLYRVINSTAAIIPVLTPPVYFQPPVSVPSLASYYPPNASSSSSAALVIAPGITTKNLTIVLNLVRINADKKNQILGLFEQYGDNCRAGNIHRNDKKEIISLTFDDESIMQELIQDLNQLYQHGMYKELRKI